MTALAHAATPQRLWSPPSSQNRAAPPPPAVAQLLHDQLRRLARNGAACTGLVLHLSRLPPPGPRPHHRRIALALLQEHARRHDGQVFALRGDDLVLLAPTPPRALADQLDRLLRSAAPGLVSLWPLDDPQRQLLAYVAARLADPVAPSTPRADAPIAALPIANLPIATALHRQTAVRLAAAGARLRPLFREISLAMAALEARLGLADAAADPFLFRHLATRLDPLLLAALTPIAGADGPLDPAPRTGPRVHLNLTLPGILSPALTRFAEACRATAAPMPGIEIAFAEACAEPAAFAQAQARLHESGLPLVLDGISPLALLLAHPARLAPGLLKLDWSPTLTQLPTPDAATIDAAIAEAGPARFVLQHADSEAALHWGLARGITRFQGRHVDAMLAAARITACPAAAACSLRQCQERASAPGAPGRRGCANPALLDRALPAHPA